MKFFLTLFISSAEEDDGDDYNTMVVKEDDNESLVRYSLLFTLGSTCKCLKLLFLRETQWERVWSRNALSFCETTIFYWSYQLQRNTVLTLSLPESILESVNVVLTFKSVDETTSLFDFVNFAKWNLRLFVSFELITLESEGVKKHFSFRIPKCVGSAVVLW